MIYPLVRRLARKAGMVITSRNDTAYPLSDGGSEYPKRKKFRHPLSLPTQWGTVSDEHMILPTSRQQAPTCVGGEGDWDSTSQRSDGAGIKVTHETIVRSVEKEPRL